MNSNMNLYGLANKANTSYIKIELDASPLQQGKEASINIYRAGFCPTDNPQEPFATFAIPMSLLNKTNQYQEHTLTLNLNWDFHVSISITKPVPWVKSI